MALLTREHLGVRRHGLGPGSRPPVWFLRKGPRPLADARDCA
ncbi:hypothetical protein [Segniliparus rotundus]|nr:hypothetical protein [Segniliparus rotundus]